MKAIRKIIILSACLLVFASGLHAQKGRLERANLLYDYQAYAEAIPKYKKLWKKDSSNSQVLIRLADCYRRINNIEKAACFYGKIMHRNLAEPIHKLQYGQLLMSLGRHEEAKNYLAQYLADQRGTTFISAMKVIEKFYKDSADYKVKTLPFNSKQNDFSPRILNNKIVYASSRKRAYAENHINTWTNQSYFKLFYTKKKKNGKFSCVHPFKHSIDNRYNSGPCSFSKQERVIYLTRNNIADTKPVRAKDGQVKLHIYAASLNKKGTRYQYLLDFMYNNDEYNFMHPAISDDGQRLYFASDMPGGKGGTDIWMCRRESGNWSAPKNLENLNSEGEEAFPFVTGKMLYYSSNGQEGIGGYDIYKVALDDKGIPAGNPYNMGYPINSPADDFGIVLNDMGSEGYFSSNRKALNMDDDIYGFTLENKDKRDILITGVTKDYETEQIMTGTTVTLIDNNNEVIEEVTVNENGNFIFMAKPNQEYTVKGVKNEYLQNEKKVQTAVDEKTNIVKTELELAKDPGLFLDVAINDSRTNLPLKEVFFEITDNATGKKYQYEIASPATYKEILNDKKIGDKLNYTVKLKKKGYYNKNAEFAYNIATKGGIKMSYSMERILAIEPVYFDYDKYNIRPDAAEKLNSLAELLQENPNWYIELYSYTDCRGGAKYNQELSEKRAKSTADYLVEKGVSKSRIVGKGMGLTKMVVDCDCKKPGESNCTEESHQLNRRTEFVVKY